MRRLTGALLAVALLAAGGAAGCEQEIHPLAGTAWSVALRAGAGDDAARQEVESWTALRARASLPRPDGTPTADTVIEPDHVGALLVGGVQVCTASVVDSPGHDLLITAAHCIHGGQGGTYDSRVTFVPGYDNGRRPYGTWTPERMLVDPRWATGSDPDMDVGFVALAPRDGRNIQDILGGNTLGVNMGDTLLVRVTGYPKGAGQPVTCVNWTSREASYQLRFDCAGFPRGTSGGPWIAGYNPATGTGTVVGVIGGYQQGGDTNWVSYSAYFDGHIRTLYDRANGGLFAIRNDGGDSPGRRVPPHRVRERAACPGHSGSTWLLDASAPAGGAALGDQPVVSVAEPVGHGPLDAARHPGGGPVRARRQREPLLHGERGG